jgi:nicotinamide N-methyltransferase
MLGKADELEHFQTGISSLFNEPEINIGDLGEVYTITFPNLKEIKVAIAQTSPENFSLFAHHIWKASIFLSKIILEDPTLVIGKRVLELGAGCGVPSIVCCNLGANVTTTDYPDSELIAKLAKNMSDNCTKQFRVEGHIWGEKFDADFFDVILMADTLWMKEQHPNLYKDLQNLLAPKGKVYGVAGLHSGRENFDAFFQFADEFGFKIVEVQPYLIPIGNGFCEDLEWTKAESVDNSKTERSRFLFKFVIMKK